ncbi:hypothetical protein [Luteolibacter luteus]|uniref:Uncharacterized protein n=1 Tax=Luteolibacter luteus TaxID=2728835 RepID=A0A858RCW4_9BACT|nr:hypothetical protein [Luteolibacter luteus]QJE94572.1 hypothetical protein HHL09_01825 [Luteolibacter luteus]
MSERIVCKPTPWFLLRAAAMLLMFGIFTVLFFIDGKWGYREKNLSYHVSKAFEQAAKDFETKEGVMSPAEWRSYAEKQTVSFPEDHSILPEGTRIPMAWPAILSDYDAMKAARTGEKNKLFNDYRLQAGMKKDAPEHDYPAGKINEQWVVFVICLVLSLGAAWVLIRTLGRSMAVDGEAFYPADGGKVPFGDLVRLDLRKWDTKGLAFLWAGGASGGERKMRIDGLTYGGFKKEQDEPAERLMGRLKENFKGEIIEYVAETEEPAEQAPPQA